MGSDGARGAEVLRRGGAEVVAQDEASSVVWGMPGAVVAAGLAHRVLPLSADRAATSAVAVARGRATALAGGRPMSLAPADFDYIRDMVRRHSAIVLDPGKEYLVESRLVPLARKEGEQSIAQPRGQAARRADRPARRAASSTR